MRSKIFLLAIFLVYGTSAVSARPPENHVDVVKHLEFVGYEVSMDSKGIRATHGNKFNIAIKQYRGGMLVTSWFGLTDHAKNNMDIMLVLVNLLNQKASSVRYFVDNDGDLTLESFYPGTYNKKSFSLFLDVFNMERENLTGSSDNISLYIK